MRLRGVLINRRKRCPACGEETMRKPAPFLLRPLLAVGMRKFAYRWCRRCLREWIAIDRRRVVVAPRVAR